MKNIHVLPTDKPTYLYKFEGKLYLSEKFEKANKFWNNQIIYITSDEEIKEGDWYFWQVTKTIQKAKKDGLGRLPKLNDGSQKIIITDNKDLIKDGVQAIDYEFLEWFVKNLSCEEVEVIEQELNTDYRSDWKQKFYYKIIIPKEEPKQTNENGKPLTYWGGLAEHKQETLEEAAERVAKLKYGPTIYGIERVNAFKDGAKWQQERMYSEEEVKQIIDTTLIEYSDFVLADIPYWFEQFKKK